MIRVTRLNGTELVINADLIETIEERPDTIVTLTNEHRFVVRESIDQLLERIAAYRQRCHPGVRKVTVEGERD
jgi:flagellar protein FlbD